MQEFIRTRGVTVCPPRMAPGAVPYRPTASGGTREETEWITANKPTAPCNEENLAKAKILTMLQDLAGKAHGEVAARLKHQNDAYRFFFSARERDELDAWCDTAGFDPDYIREQAKKVHENGMPALRAAAGTGARYDERKRYRDIAKLKAERP